MNSIPQTIAVKLDVENINIVMKNIYDSFAEIQKEFDKYKDKRDYGFRFILHSIFLNNFKDNETYKLVESIANKKGRQIFYKEAYSDNRDYATFEKSLLSLHFNKNEQIINKRDYGFRFILHLIFLNNFKESEVYKLVESIANKRGRQIFYKEAYSDNRDYATFEKSLLSLHFNKNEQIINSIVNDVKSLLPKSNLDDEFILDCSINSTIFKAYCGFKKEIEIQSILNQIFKDNNSFLRVFEGLLRL